MTEYNATPVIEQLLSYGLTLDQIENESHIDSLRAETIDGKTQYIIGGALANTYILGYLERQTETNFITIDGERRIVGRNLTTGQEVDVWEETGPTTVVVGEIIGTDDNGKTIADFTPENLGSYRVRRDLDPNCPHVDVSNTGDCYACGGYLASHDLNV